MRRPRAVYCVAVLLIAKAVWSLYAKSSLLLTPEVTWWWKLLLVSYPGLLLVLLSIGLLMLKKWAWFLVVVWSLANGMGLLSVWFGMGDEFLLRLLDTRGRVAWWGIYAVLDLAVVVLLTLRPTRGYFFQPQPPRRVPTASDT